MGAIFSFGGHVLKLSLALIAADAIVTGTSAAVSAVKSRMSKTETDEQPKKAGRPKSKTETK